MTFPAAFLSAGVVGACEDLSRMSRMMACDGERVSVAGIETAGAACNTLPSHTCCRS